MKKSEFNNKTCLITGASRGLGLNIANEFYINGSNVVLISRNLKDLKIAKKKIENKNLKNEIYMIVGDISKKKISEGIVKKSLDKFGKIDYLINNAGIYGPIGQIDTVNYKDILETINTNILGSLNMSLAVIPHMKKNKKGKIIQIAGGGATKPIENFSIYSLSKSAIVRFTETIAHELYSYNININSVSPGFLKTRMTDQVIKAGGKKAGEQYYKSNVMQKKRGGDGFDRACKLILFLCSNKSKKIYGKLISAIWDNWSILNKYPNISNNDIFTLRRIIGKERGFKKLDK